MSKPRVLIVAGTRPEAVKMAPVQFALEGSGKLEPVFCSTAQHREMMDQTLGVFGITPDIDLDLMTPGQTLPGLTAAVIEGATRALREVRPAAVLVQGDTTTVLGTALAAFYERVPIAHVEAGLRTHDLEAPWPEEMNRRLVDPIARWCFAPTEHSRDNLLRESVPEELCQVTGNTVIDALLWIRAKQEAEGTNAAEIAGRCGIASAFAGEFLEGGKPWILVTGHRRESFGAGFEGICAAILSLVGKWPDLGVLYPVHLNPKVQEPVLRLLGDHPRICLARPCGYYDFVWLMNRCHFLLSDSGGVQEEAPSLGKPVLVMRETTERPEGIEAGTCRLVGTDPARITEEAGLLLGDEREYERRSELRNPYGDGRAAVRIRERLERDL
ncbi:MAG: non-hydrolyzing UDP-N-acetylglucosamine 2-epimerase [Puniceicoccaceae bacterium]